MLIGILMFAACLIMGFPIYVCLLVIGLYVQLFVNHIPPDMIISALLDGVAKPSLLAIPFFLLAGGLMEHSSLSSRLVGTIKPLLRRVRGGIPLTALVANEIFGAMSGSAPAATATIGRVMLPAITETNGERFGLGLLTSAGSIAIIMPPSINMIVFAAATDTSIGDLFLAGIIPALVVFVILGAYIFYMSKTVSDQKFSMQEAIKGLTQGFWVLLLPVIILGGIYSGICTPTEAGAVAAVYALLLPLFVFKDFNWKILKDTFLESAMLNAQIFILVAASIVFSQALTIAQVPQSLAERLAGVNPFIFLLGLNVLLLIVGCFFDPVSAVLVLAPMMIPITAKLGINPIHLGIVFTVNLAIGMFTPPFGLNLFVMQSIFKKSMEAIVDAVWPFIILYILVLAIITYFPQLYIWLPQTLRGLGA